MSGIFVGINGLARKIEKMYVGLNGKAKLIEKCYVGINGKARIVFNSIENSSGGFSITYSDGSTIFYDCGENITSDFLSENGFYQNEQTGYFDFGDATSIEIHNGVTTIEEGIFTSLPKVTSLYLPRSLSSLGSFNFTITPLLTTIKVDPNNTTYDSRNNCNAIIETSSNTLLSGCNTTVIPNSVTNIGYAAFYGSNVETIIIPEGITYIGKYAFFDSNITYITLPESLQEIDSFAFMSFDANTGLIKSSVSSYVILLCAPPVLNTYSFCMGAQQDFQFKINKKYISEYNNDDSWSDFSNYFTEYIISQLSIIRNDGTKENKICEEVLSTDIIQNPNNIKEIIISGGVTQIIGTFSDCTSLDILVFESETPPSISSNAFDTISSSLSIKVPLQSVDVYKTSLNWSKYSDIISSYSVIITNEDDTILHTNISEIQNKDTVKYIEISENVTSIEDNALSDFVSLISIDIPDSVTSIGDNAFKGCTSLSSVIISESVDNIGNSAFEDCSSLTFVTLKADTTSPCSLGTNVFNNTSSNLTIRVPKTSADAYKASSYWVNYSDIIYGVNSTSNYYSFLVTYNDNTKELFGYNDPISYDKRYKIIGINIQEGVTAIDNYKFYGCGKSSNEPINLVLPKSLKKIGYESFSCSYITSVTIPKNVIYIGGKAFNLSSLENISVDADNIIYNSENNCNAVIETATNKLVIGCKNTVIPSHVSSIDYCAFYNCESLTSIIIPSGVTNIGSSAFEECSSLISVTIPDSVTSIEDYAFNYCTSLSSINILGSITSISEGMFSNCNSLTTVTIPDSVTSIEDYAFTNCYSLVTVTIPEGVTSIGKDAFYNCTSLTSVTIPSSVTIIDEEAFCNCTSLTSVTISEGVTSIGEEAFSNCNSLTTITIPSGVTSIENETFEGCSSLTEIVLPEGITSIGEYAFSECFALLTVDIPSTVTSISKFAFCECSSLSSVVIPEGVTDISYNAFSYCSSLTSVTLPSSVTNISIYAFYCCYDLASINIPEGVTSIGEEAFYKCESLTSINIPEGVTSIDYRTFNSCSSLTSVNLPESITSIGEEAFEGCSSLTSINIPEGVTSIGDWAFCECEALTSINLPNSITSINDCAFDGCSSLTSINIPSGMTSIADETFKWCTSLTTITIPENITSIGTEAFAYCSSLANVVISSITPPTLKYASYRGIRNFYNTSSTLKIYVPSSAVDTYKTADGWSEYADKIVGYSLILTKTDGTIEYRTSSDVTDDKSVIESVILAPGTTSVSGWQFYNCSSLTSITIPNSVTKIEEAAISYCSSLTSITIPNSVTSLDTEAFSGCRSLTSITIPSSVKSVGIYAFSHCKSLVSVVIKDGITNLGSSAFSDCPQLTTVTLETVTPPSTDEWLFTDCSSLSSIYVPSSAVDTYKTADGWSEYADKIVGY